MEYPLNINTVFLQPYLPTTSTEVLMEYPLSITNGIRTQYQCCIFWNRLLGSGWLFKPLYISGYKDNCWLSIWITYDCWLSSCLGIKCLTLAIVLKKRSVTGSWLYQNRFDQINPSIENNALYICDEIWIEPLKKSQWFSSLPCHRVCFSMVRVYWFSW